MHHIHSSLSTFERLQLGKQVAAAMNDYRMAVWVDETLLDEDKLIETVAVNRGAKFGVFLELSEALIWLGVEKNQAVVINLDDE